MRQEISEWKSASGGKLHAQIWEPTSEIKAVVCLVHGFGEHCSRYTPYIELFDTKGVAFVSYDQMGHGLSEGKRGVISTYNHLLDDVQQCISKADEKFPGLPIFLYGHSMGGNIAFNFLLKRNSQLKGGVITSPWLTLSSNPSFLVRALVSFVKLIIPNITVDSGLELNYISSMESEVEKYKNDKLNHGRISFRLFYEITRNGLWAMLNASKLEVPILLMHGTGDKITSHYASELTAKTNKNSITYIEWPNSYHELHNDTVRAQLADTVNNWIESHNVG